MFGKDGRTYNVFKTHFISIINPFFFLFFRTTLLAKLLWSTEKKFGSEKKKVPVGIIIPPLDPVMVRLDRQQVAHTTTATPAQTVSISVWGSPYWSVPPTKWLSLISAQIWWICHPYSTVQVEYAKTRKFPKTQSQFKNKVWFTMRRNLLNLVSMSKKLMFCVFGVVKIY